jgi:hypothetical protein
MFQEKLIGKFYPVKNENNEIVGFKKITKVIEFENIAAYGVALNNSESYITLGYAEAVKIADGLYQFIE